MEKSKLQRRELIKAIKVYWRQQVKNKFIAGKSLIPASGKVIDQQDIGTMVEAVLDGWLTEGRFARRFERALANYFGLGFAILTNSGSSANLLAMSALTSFKLKERRLKPGDKVITLAAGFPTTINPIIQNQLVPVFVDVELGYYNVDIKQLKKALNKQGLISGENKRVKAIIMAHTLGNPFNLAEVKALADRYNLWLVEDCCDALGASYQGKRVGAFGDLATLSFYPAHQITTGEGGAVVTDNPLLMKIVRSLRDWGRDCWCRSGEDNSCGKRFGWQLGHLPLGYDHKYIFSHIGYNLKMTDIQAALGLSQLKKLPQLIQKRQANFRFLYMSLKKYHQFFILPEKLPGAKPSWFGFLLTVRKEAPFSKNEIVNYLETKKIATRPLFAGNITKHPAFETIKYRLGGKLTQTDLIMRRSFWIGVYPGLDRTRLAYVVKCFDDYLAKFKASS